MSETDPQPEPPAKTVPKTFLDTLWSSVLTGLPALSALVFIIVAVKVFRASMMETTTTVAIVSTANSIDLLKGVILTLLPGLLAGLVAISIWWWAAVLPTRLDGPSIRDETRRSLFSPQALWAWAMIVMAFFTVWWPVFLLLLIPVLWTTAVLTPLSLGVKRLEVEPGWRVFKVAVCTFVALLLAYELLLVKEYLGFSWPAYWIYLVPLLVVPLGVLFALFVPAGEARALRPVIKGFGLVGAGVFIGLLTLAPTVWLPLRAVTFDPGQSYTLNGRVLPNTVAAYVLSSDASGATLLLNNPRAVIQVGPNVLDPQMPFCVPPESRLRVLTVRASQVLHLDSDPHTPYQVCPEIRQRLLGGG